jgi:hypothetical protein
MKRLLALVAVALAFVCVPTDAGIRINQTFTITAGTPICVGTGLTTASTGARMAVRVFIQALSGANAGVVYVMDGISYGRIPSSSSSSDLTAQLSPASASAPGGNYSDVDTVSLIDMNQLWIDGAHTGDKVQVSFVPKF